MSPAHKDSIVRWLPPLVTVALSVVAAWVAMSTRVAALEVRVDERKDDIAQIRQDVKEVRQQVSEIHGALLGDRHR